MNTITQTMRFRQVLIEYSLKNGCRITIDVLQKAMEIWKTLRVFHITTAITTAATAISQPFI